MRTVTVKRPVGPSEASPTDVDVTRLRDGLEEVVRGEVRFDRSARALYSTDASNYRQVPLGVVVPVDKDDVVAAVAVCRRHGAPIFGRGAGTSLAGQTCNVGVVFDFSKYMNRVLSVDPDAREALVEPGCVLDRLRDAAEQHGLTFGPDPATHDRCTLGGMVMNNSCGVHSQMSGRTVDYVLELEVLTYDGGRFWVGPADDAEIDRIVRAGGPQGEAYAALRRLRDTYARSIRTGYPRLPRRVSGYNLDELLPERCNVARALVGTESTCVLVLEARLRLIASPPERRMLVVGWPDIATLADHIPEILAHASPIGLEAFDQRLVDYMRRKHLHEAYLDLVPAGGAWMIVEFGADTAEEAEHQARRLKRHLDRKRRGPNVPSSKYPTTTLYFDPDDMARVWELRESGLGATARVPGAADTWPGWEDAAVPPERLGAYLRDFRALLDEFDYEASLYGHFGMGCVHTRIPFRLDEAQGIRDYRRFVERAAELVVRYGGSISGEHGDGQSRAELLGTMYGPDLLEAMRRFKAVWDPHGKMNPGKVVDPAPLDSHLRLGKDYRPWEPRTFLDFPEDDGRFSRAALRCVGVGKCRRTGSGVMCPSYQVTLEEEHSTRGRARALFEMMQGDVIADRWKSEEVKDALDLCLSCKGCLVECPVNVDMATYKAEFLYHYHKHRRRPRQAYAFGYVDIAAHLASKAPRLADLATQRPLGAVTKRVAGLAPERPLPRFARQTLREWFASRPPEAKAGPEVVLFPDTFTNHFDPHIGKAAVRVLETSGHTVRIPERRLCCGRPLYDHGMLRRARRLMRRNVEALRPFVRAGIPIVVLEPSCAAAFRDELPKVLPRDADARRLTDATRTLAEFLDERPEALGALGLPQTRPSVSFDRVERDDAPSGPPSYLVQRHCHHQAVMGFGADRAILDRLGVDHEVLDSGCCGLAGSFGFEADHYAVSMAIGERVLLPRARAAPRGTRFLADGFSCRQQLHHGADRQGMHLAELLAAHLDPGRTVPARPRHLPRIVGGRPWTR